MSTENGSRVTETPSSAENGAETVGTDIVLRNGVVVIPMPVAGQVLEISEDQERLDAKQAAKLSPLGIGADCPPQQVIAFLREARARNLDPWRREIYLLKYGPQWVHHIGIAGFRTRAAQTGLYDGCDPFEFADVNGRWTTLWTDKTTNPHACRVTMYRRDRSRPIVWTVYFDEYAATKEEWVNGSKRKVLAANWRTAANGGKPLTMLIKCCQAAAFREAFSEVFAGLYEPAEFEKIAADLEREHGPVIDDAAVAARRAAYAAAHPGVVNAEDVGVTVTETTDAGDPQDETPAEAEALPESQVRMLLVAELDVQAGILGRPHAWLVQGWEGRNGKPFAEATTAEMLAHVHRWRPYVIEELRRTGRYLIAARYSDAIAFGPAETLFGHAEPWKAEADRREQNAGAAA